MASLPDLPVDMHNDSTDVTQTASTPTDYWNLKARGYVAVEGPAVAALTYDELTPAQKAARTRAENKAREAAEQEQTDSSGEGDSADNHKQAGDATGDES